MYCLCTILGYADVCVDVLSNSHVLLVDFYTTSHCVIIGCMCLCPQPLICIEFVGVSIFETEEFDSSQDFPVSVKCSCIELEAWVIATVCY